MRSILRPVLLIVLVAGLAVATACGPSPRLAGDAEAEILADEASDIEARLVRWREALGEREKRAGQGSASDRADDAEAIIALRMTISQDRARLRQCQTRRAELAR